jgi:hypothetical protein
MSACSACAGDYEDPDRTAWLVDEDENENDETETQRDALRGGEPEEFPAEE